MVRIDKMIKARLLTIGLALALLATPLVAIASDISDAQYYGIILVSNNATAATNVATTANISTDNLISGNYLNATATNAVVRNSSGADVAFMPGYTPDNGLWCFWVPSIGTDSYLNYILYTANSTGGKYRYFPGDGGMTISDDASMEPSDNFSLGMTGWFNTSATMVGENVTTKHETGVGGIRIRVIAEGEVTSSIYASGSYLDFVRVNSDDVRIPDHNDFSFTDGAGNDEPFTIIAWVNFDDATSSTIAGKHQAAGDNLEWYFKTNATDNLTLILFHNTGGQYIGRETDVITGYEGSWIHVAATYDGSETSAGINIYINGVDADTTTTDALPYTGMTNRGENVHLGAYNVGAVNFLDGGMAEVKVYSAELTPARIVSDYVGSHSSANLIAYWKIDDGAGNPQDSSGNAHHANANDADWAVGFTERGRDVTATGLSSGEYALEVGLSGGEYTALVDSRDVLEFDGTANSYVNCGVIHNAAAKLWVVLTFVLDAPVDSTLATPFFLWSKKLDANNQLIVRLEDGTGKLQAYLKTGAITRFVIYAKDSGGVETTSWSAGVCYTVLLSISDVNNVRFRYNDGVVVTNADGNAAPNGGIFTLGNTGVAVANSFIGTISNVFVGTDDLTIGEESHLLSGIPPADAVNIWLLDEATGTNIVDYGTGSNNGTAGAACTWNDGIGYANYYIDIGGDSWGVNLHGVSVPDNAADWTVGDDGVTPYIEEFSLDVGGTEVCNIVWEYDNIFYDTSGYGNDATPTFRTASSDADVSASWTAFLPIAEAIAPDYVLGTVPAFIDADALSGNVTGTFGTTPGAGAGTFPLAGVITAMAAATSTPAQLPLLIIAVFIILAASLSVSAIMRSHGSGSLIVKIITIAALMGIFVALGNFAIEFWMILVFLIISVAVAFASRQLGWT